MNGMEHSSACSVTGRNNAELQCEDVLYLDETPRMKFFGLADGQSKKKFCRYGGKEVLRALFCALGERGITRMSESRYVDELQYELIRVVRETIAAIASEEGAEQAEFASTLVIFAFEPETGNYVILHLGDGGIIGRKRDGDICMLSSPENGLTRNYTWLTTSREALMHLRIAFGNIGNFSRLVMFTDGATEYAYGQNITERARRTICHGSREEVVSLLEGSNPIDDASCIVIDFES